MGPPTPKERWGSVDHSSLVLLGAEWALWLTGHLIVWGVTGVGLASAWCNRGHGEPCFWGRGSRGHHGGGVTLLPCTDPHSLLVFQAHGDPATLWQPVSKSGVQGPDAPVHHSGRGVVTEDERRLLFTLGLTIPGPVEICGAAPAIILPRLPGNL